ncbi:hypothetical protein CASFOL_032864 [Castilleja foliolosa]|uniref:Glycosyltransferase n=1 Tax=Castilleja foliolosa TaxID=1961234 RepID=A0ABD3C3K5_9LAMI
MSKKPHVLVVTYPAQGHVIPVLEFSQWLVRLGVRVTFVNTEFSHKKIINFMSDSDKFEDLTMVTIPDGLEPGDDRKDLGKNTEALYRVPPGELESLILKINGRDEDKIACVIADAPMAWALEVAEKLGIRRAAFWTAPAAVLALSFHIPKLISDGIVDTNGKMLKNETIQLSSTMPRMNSGDFIWASIGDEPTQTIFFHSLIRNNAQLQSVDYVIINSSHDLEPASFSLIPNSLSVGPLLASNRLGKTVGYFWPEDSACLAWLDQQPTNSVIYVSFGTSTELDQSQFEELALGLELTNKPFLWVVREDISTAKMYPEGFKVRVRDRGVMVSWAPQQQVLSHPSVACFVSHCGWNSTIEGVSCGVPFICCPYYADQMLNQTYICDEWKVGLGLSKDESGIMRKQEIKGKLEGLLSDGGFKERALDLRAKVMKSVKEGLSYENLNKLVEWIKDN